MGELIPAPRWNQTELFVPITRIYISDMQGRKNRDMMACKRFQTEENMTMELKMLIPKIIKMFPKTKRFIRFVTKTEYIGQRNAYSIERGGWLVDQAIVGYLSQASDTVTMEFPVLRHSARAMVSFKYAKGWMVLKDSRNTIIGRVRFDKKDLRETPVPNVMKVLKAEIEFASGYIQARYQQHRIYIDDGKFIVLGLIEEEYRQVETKRFVKPFEDAFMSISKNNIGYDEFLDRWVHRLLKGETR